MLSIVHASYGRPERALQVIQQIVAAADNPDSFEYILGIDSQDPDHHIYLNQAYPKQVELDILSGRTAVQASNHAASIAMGCLQIGAIDHVEFPPHWDTMFLEAIKGIEHTEFLLHVDDGDSRPHYWSNFPSPSRAYVESRGYSLWHEYIHYYCDVDAYDEAMLRGKIVKATHIKMKHHHYMNNPNSKRDATYAKSEASVGHDHAVYMRRKADNFGVR